MQFIQYEIYIRFYWKDSSFENINYQMNLKTMSLLRFKTWIQSYNTF